MKGEAGRGRKHVLNIGSKCWEFAIYRVNDEGIWPRGAYLGHFILVEVVKVAVVLLHAKGLLLFRHGCLVIKVKESDQG